MLRNFSATLVFAIGLSSGEGMVVAGGVAAAAVEFQLSLDVAQHAARAEPEQLRGRASLSPSSSFMSVSQSSDWRAVRRPPAGLNPTAMPVRSWYSRIARVITRPTGSVALTGSLPVEVLMKSAPAIMATRLARATLRSVPRSPVPEDHLAVRRSTGLLEGCDLLVKTMPVSSEHVRAGDDDVDLIRARIRPSAVPLRGAPAMR